MIIIKYKLNNKIKIRLARIGRCLNEIGGFDLTEGIVICPLLKCFIS